MPVFFSLNVAFKMQLKEIKMLSTAAKPYIDASVPVLRQHGLAITTVFYKNMLDAHPELNNLFNQGNQANGSQQQSLAAAVFAYAANIENAAALAPVIERIVHKHVSIGILPSHYPIVAKYLIGAIKDVLGDAATTELISAWDEAYWLLAGDLIATEARLYDSNGNAEKQWLKMKVAKKEHLTEDIVSITLIPNNDDALPPFKAGQYISIAAHLEELNLRQIRQYSLSDAENENYYRITVKREKGDEFKPEGKFSKWVHQHVRVGSVLDVSHPYGTFTPDLTEESPITLISAGVGITPMLSMLNTLVNQKTKRKVVFVHAARSEKNLAHYDEIKAAKLALQNLQTTIYLNEKNRDEFLQGKMDLPVILSKDILSGKFFICGPTAFMDDQWKVLIELGVNPANIEREVFGPESLSHLL
jgi:nitric oxide dioxygenase